MTPARAARQREILAAAASLLGDRGAETVTMDEIAARAGVAKGTLYLYFASKDDLVRELFGTGLGRVVAEIRAQPTARRAIDVALRFQISNPDWFRLRQRADSSDATRATLRAREPELRRAVAGALAGAGAAIDDPDRVAGLALGAIDAAVRRYLERDTSPGDVATESVALWRFLRRAIGAPDLAGRTVLVTRDEETGGPLSDAFRARGAHCVSVPLLETRPVDDAAELAAHLERASTYDWVFLTSTRAADAIARTLEPNGRSLRFAVVGEATARRVRSSGWEPELVGAGGAVELVREMSSTFGDLTGRSVLFPASDRVLGDGVRALSDAGALVDVVTAYRTVVRESARDPLSDALARGDLVLTFTSPSAVDAFVELAGTHGFVNRPIAALGPTTARRLAELGATRAIVSPEPDFESFADAVALAHFRKDTDLA